MALCLEDIEGRHPHEPWTERDLSLVVATLEKMAALLTPAPFDAEDTAAVPSSARSMDGKSLCSEVMIA